MGVRLFGCEQDKGAGVGSKYNLNEGINKVYDWYKSN